MTMNAQRILIPLTVVVLALVSLSEALTHPTDARSPRLAKLIERRNLVTSPTTTCEQLRVYARNAYDEAIWHEFYHSAVSAHSHRHAKTFFGNAKHILEVLRDQLNADEQGLLIILASMYAMSLIAVAFLFMTLLTFIFDILKTLCGMFCLPPQNTVKLVTVSKSGYRPRGVELENVKIFRTAEVAQPRVV